MLYMVIPVNPPQVIMKAPNTLDGVKTEQDKDMVYAWQIVSANNRM